MKTTTVLLLALLSVAAYADKSASQDLVSEARYWLEGVSGFWQGFESGLYHDAARSQGCLDTQTKNELIEIIASI